MKKQQKSVVIISGPDAHHFIGNPLPPNKGKVWKWVKGIFVGAIVSLAETTIHTTFTTGLYGLLSGLGLSVGLVSWLTILIPFICVGIITAVICEN